MVLVDGQSNIVYGGFWWVAQNRMRLVTGGNDKSG